MKFVEQFPHFKEMRSLSWKQPFASLMLHGKIETRTWPTKYRGWVLICASMQPYGWRQLMDISGEEQYDRMVDVLGYSPASTMRGCAIAVGKLISSKKMEESPTLFASSIPTRQEIEDKCFVKFNPDLYLHEYTEVHQIKPFIIKGTQGWKTLDIELINSIELL